MRSTPRVPLRVPFLTTNARSFSCQAPWVRRVPKRSPAPVPVPGERTEPGTGFRDRCPRLSGKSLLLTSDFALSAVLCEGRTALVGARP